MIRARKLGGRNNLTALYAHMTEPGRLNAWQDSWELAQYIRTTCLHTMIAEIRAQVPATRRVEHSSERRDGRVKNYYRIVEVAA